ncbi:MAG: hypothetical protein WA632_03280 [Gallionella sp.]
MSAAERLNADCQNQGFNYAALRSAMIAEGSEWFDLVTERCPHLFSEVPVFVTAEHLQQMRAVISAIDRVTNLPGWRPESLRGVSSAKGVFFGYDFHLNMQGAHLIEINTNAGGGFLNALLINSQRGADLPGKPVCGETLGEAFTAMFANEWRLSHRDSLLKTIAIVDENPQQQYLYPEFLLAKKLFESAGLRVYIVDPSELKSVGDNLYAGEHRIDLVYNRLTDFSLRHHAVLRQAWLQAQVVLTPDVEHYDRYADKRNLGRLCDSSGLRLLGADEKDIALLQQRIPHTLLVSPEAEAALWADRKKLFFKPISGYGSKGAYRGDKLTKRVFAEIIESEYVVQSLAIPGERKVCINDDEVVSLKYDLRCYVYDGEIQLVSARLYQGQTTNFRTPGGGFALVRVVE